MKLSYKDQRILLTGASAGIGQDMADILASEAKLLILVARRHERLKQLQQKLQEQYPNCRILVYACDVSDTKDIDGLLHFISQEAGAIDILINNAGVGDFSLFENASWVKTENMLRLNIEGLTYLTHKLLPPMITLERGGILNVSSGFGMFYMPGMAVYAATKHYVTAFTEALRAELQGSGVVVSQLCPGPVATEFGTVAGHQHLETLAPQAMLSSKQCAQEALIGFSRGKALIVPGQNMRWLMGLGRLVPRPVLRLAFSTINIRKRLIKLQEAAAGTP